MQDVIQRIVTFISENLYLILGIVLVVLIIRRVRKPSTPKAVQMKAMPVVEEQMKADKPEEVILVTEEDLVAPSPVSVPNYITPTDTGEYATAGEVEEELSPPPAQMVVMPDEM